MEFDALEDFLSRQRAIRVFDTSKPVDEALIERMLRVATFAPTGGNRQLWRFLVIRDPAIKAQLAKIYEEEATKYLGGRTLGTTSWAETPVLIAVLSEKDGGGPSIYPAVQNLLLAASALGLGSVLTTLWKAQEPAVKKVLGIPDEIEMHAILPVGWPDRKYGRSKRLPFSEVSFRDKYGQAW